MLVNVNLTFHINFLQTDKSIKFGIVFVVSLNDGDVNMTSASQR